MLCFFFKQKTAYDLRISDWSSDVCSSDLVSPTATVALIDADSFQLTHNGSQYLCAVGVPEYTPPELQGRSLKSIVRTQDHDAFGLEIGRASCRESVCQYV